MIQQANSGRKRSVEQNTKRREAYAIAKLMQSTPEGQAECQRIQIENKENKINNSAAFRLKKRERQLAYRESVKDKIMEAQRVDPEYKVAKRIRYESVDQLARWDKQRYANIVIRRHNSKLAELAELRRENDELRLHCGVISKAPISVDQALLNSWLQHSPNAQTEWFVQNGHFPFDAVAQMQIDGGDNYVTGMYIMLKVSLTLSCCYRTRYYA
jgi:hypothetical protein